MTELSLYLSSGRCFTLIFIEGKKRVIFFYEIQYHSTPSIVKCFNMEKLIVDQIFCFENGEYLYLYLSAVHLFMYGQCRTYTHDTY